MSHLREEDRLLLDRAFDALPEDRRVRLYGLDYAVLRMREGGELFITRYGWPRRRHLAPEQWFIDRRYADTGNKLGKATGTVYRVPTFDAGGRRIDLVVKFSRFAQPVPLHVHATFPDDTPREVLEAAYWNDPFEEFGRVHDLRRGRFGPPELVILTKRPLAIYSPPQEYPDWQLGRSSSEIALHDALLATSQQEAAGHEPVHLHARREYILLYEWIKGEDAEDCMGNGRITADEANRLTRHIAADLRRKGFRVLDHKPRHVILRPHGQGVLRRRGQFVYGLVDFELLQRTAEYVAWLNENRKHPVRKEA